MRIQARARRSRAPAALSADFPGRSAGPRYGSWSWRPTANRIVDLRYDRENPRTRQRALVRSEEHTSELQSHHDIVCRLLLEKKKIEPTPSCEERILSPARLPFRHFGCTH